jgi:hypothetical protein
MDTKKLFYYLSFLSIRSLFSGKKTKREIMGVISTLIVFRLGIYGAMALTNFHPMSFL